jgi:hypothetical protein
MKLLLVMWILSLLAAVGTGWLVFSNGQSTPLAHAVFLLCVGAFLASSLWLLARGLSPLPRQPDDADSSANEARNDRRN